MRAMNGDVTSGAAAGEPTGPDATDGGLWPSPDYVRQVEVLRAAIGETVFVAELEVTDVQLGARLTDRPYVLLGVVDFPRPDPARGLAPHLVLLDDGRGVNLGRIARITRSRPFSPAPDDVVYQDRPVLQGLLFNERRLSPAYIAHQSRRLLGELLGAQTAGSPALDAPEDHHRETDEPPAAPRPANPPIDH
jgi:hypothetical protein